VFSSGCLRIGHGGASALAPANTLASFDAALGVGVDMVEFDVRECRGDLVLAHTVFHSRRKWNLRLEEALSHLSHPRFDGIGLNVDVKRPGFEPRLLDELSQAGFIERTVVSSQIPLVLDRLRELEPRLRLGISVGGRVARTSRRWRDWRAAVLSGLTARRWDVLMAQYRLVDADLLGSVVDRSGRLYAWTVNERGAIDRLSGLGVHGIATGDPRLFV
jgi:glycerophosphoryl diester phosphodiesterase